MQHLIAHHLNIGAEHTVGNGGDGRLFFLPGSDGRARRLSERFVHRQVIASDRQLNVYLGQLEAGGLPVDVGAVATGMGCPSVDIVLTELITQGARHFIRVGTAGSLQPGEVPAGSLVIATAAVRDEGTSGAYVCTEYPAVADARVVRALESAAQRCGHAEHTFSGVVHSKDSLFAREFGMGPRRQRNLDYMAELEAMGVLATEMETAHLLILSYVHPSTATPLSEEHPGGIIRSGAVLAVIGDDRPFAGKDLVAETEAAAVEVALAGAVELLR